ncbi:MAG: DUF3426 domain-containing protein [Alphaproteobacteria bacterium]|nr:DUF3426 domain-containing protein [Alphaproteobacteria bacterium]
MKTVCPFCKVEYSVKDANGARSFECAVCGHVWRESRPRRNSRIWIFMLACAILVLAVLSFIAVVRYMPRETQGPLGIKMDSAVMTADGMVVSGVIANKSDKLNGVPDVVVVLKDANGAELSSQVFPPPAPLLDAGESISFSVTVKDTPVRASKIGVEFKE